MSQIAEEIPAYGVPTAIRDLLEAEANREARARLDRLVLSDLPAPPVAKVLTARKDPLEMQAQLDLLVTLEVLAPKAQMALLVTKAHPVLLVLLVLKEASDRLVLADPMALLVLKVTASSIRRGGWSRQALLAGVGVAGGALRTH